MTKMLLFLTAILLCFMLTGCDSDSAEEPKVTEPEEEAEIIEPDETAEELADDCEKQEEETAVEKSTSTSTNISESTSEGTFEYKSIVKINGVVEEGSDDEWWLMD